MSTTYPSDLTDAEWACIQRYLPALSTRGRPRTHPLRRILDAIFYVVRSGCAWRYLPSNFPPWQTVLIVCTQMTKPDVLTGRRRREDVADLDITVCDDHAINEQFDQLAALVEGGACKSALYALTEARERARHLREGLLLVHVRLHLLLP